MAIIPGSFTNIDLKVTPSTLIKTLAIGTTATAVRYGASDLVGRRLLFIQNNTLNAIWLKSDSGVAQNNGIYLATGASIQFDLDPLHPVTLYAISTGTGSSINIMEG